jgi:hypothetical protein
MIDDGDDEFSIDFIDVENEGVLNPNHNEMPVYVPCLKANISIGHFVIISVSPSKTVVGQILGRGHAEHAVNVCCFLPLYAMETMRHINNPPILPRKICSTLCLDVVELINISRVAEVNVMSIMNVAFIFLECDVINNLYPIQGMDNAYVTRFLYSPSRMALVPLDGTSFHCFPDLNPVHAAAWSECYGRTIFNCIDQLRQEIWRFLFRYGQSQGHFPQQFLRLNFPPTFTCYLCNFFRRLNIQYQFAQVRESKRHLDAKLSYRMITIAENYMSYSLETPDVIQKFTRLIGASSFIGIRKPKPKLGVVSTTKTNDAVNVLSRIYVDVSYSKVRLKLHAYQHIVGVDTNNIPLISSMEHEAPGQPPDIGGRHRNNNTLLRINSKFDYEGNVCKVDSVNPDGTVVTSSLWGPQSGERIVFNSVVEVLHLVNLKRG